MDNKSPKKQPAAEKPLVENVNCQDIEDHKDEEHGFPNPLIQVWDCTDNKKLILLRNSGLMLLAIQDSQRNYKWLIPLQLKRPYAKNFQKLAKTMLPINDSSLKNSK